MQLEYLPLDIKTHISKFTNGEFMLLNKQYLTDFINEINCSNTEINYIFSHPSSFDKFTNCKLYFIIQFIKKLFNRLEIPFNITKDTPILDILYEKLNAKINVYTYSHVKLNKDDVILFIVYPHRIKLLKKLGYILHQHNKYRFLSLYTSDTRELFDKLLAHAFIPSQIIENIEELNLFYKQDKEWCNILLSSTIELDSILEYQAELKIVYNIDRIFYRVLLSNFLNFSQIIKFGEKLRSLYVENKELIDLLIDIIPEKLNIIMEHLEYLILLYKPKYKELFTEVITDLESHNISYLPESIELYNQGVSISDIIQQFFY